MSLPKTLIANASILFFAASLGLGCASSGDDVGGTGSAATDETITLDNHVAHPSIAAIRREVQTVEALGLKPEENPGCDGSNSKFVDGSKKIRKYVSTGGEGESAATRTAWYDAEGKLVFVFSLHESFGDEMKAKEHRVWVKDGQILFQTIKEAPIVPESRTANFSGTKPRLPVGDEAMGLAEGEGVMNPEKDFQSTGCAQPEAAPTES